MVVTVLIVVVVEVVDVAAVSVLKVPLLITGVAVVGEVVVVDVVDVVIGDQRSMKFIVGFETFALKSLGKGMDLEPRVNAPSKRFSIGGMTASLLLVRLAGHPSRFRGAPRLSGGAKVKGWWHAPSEVQAKHEGAEVATENEQQWYRQGVSLLQSRTLSSYSGSTSGYRTGFNPG